MTTSVGSLIQRARDHHPAFTVEKHPHRVALAYLSTRYPELLKILTAALRDRLSQARTVADTIDGSLVGVDDDGVEFSVLSGGEGYALVVGADGVPYLDDTALSSDPYATGFPLPAESLHIIDLYATMAQTGELKQITVVPQQELSRRTGARGTLEAIINGWRLFPLRNPDPNVTGSQDISSWAQVASVTTVWVETPARFVEAMANWENQSVALPDIYATVLEYDLAAHFAARQTAIEKDFTMLKFYQGAAEEALARCVSGARLDHSGVRVNQTRRNR